MIPHCRGPLRPLLSQLVKGRSAVGEPKGEQARVAVVIVASNAADTLASVLDQLPASFKERVEDVVVCDDASGDTTFSVGKDYQAHTELPLTVIRRPRNLGYGGNQKAAYKWIIERGLDIVVLLHGDGQYAPEVIEDLLEPLERGSADAVLGSRLIDSELGRPQGMPMYKYIGNRVLSKYCNSIVGLNLTEWHSGYRAYRVQALNKIPFEVNSDGFDFDTEIILQLHEAGQSIAEVPIPSYYGGDISYVNGLRYAFNVATDVTRYRIHKMGFGSGELAFADEAYELKMDKASSHRQIISWLTDGPPKRILDLGCSDGRFGELLRLDGHHVIGVDTHELDGVRKRLDGFYEADLNRGLPTGIGQNFDAVVAADVFEHLATPEKALQELLGVLSPRGIVIASVPNVAHWYPRLRILLGRFDYERRGILDSGHLRFFTEDSFVHMAHRAGMRVRQRSRTGLPLDVANRGGSVPSVALNLIGGIDAIGLKLFPGLFSYQLLFELEPDDSDRRYNEPTQLQDFQHTETT